MYFNKAQRQILQVLVILNSLSPHPSCSPFDDTLNSPPLHSQYCYAVGVGSILMGTALKSDTPSIDMAAISEREKGMGIAEDAAIPIPQTSRRGARFWLVILSLCFAAFGANMNATILSTVLPTIARDLGANEEYIWIVSSYTIAATACIPLLGQMANIAGRRNTMLFAVAAFTVGSGIGGGATNLGMLLVGRVIQGIGGGGIMLLIELIPSDLLPVRERSKYFAIIMSSCTLGVTIGPVVGGALADNGNWRWALYINVPTAGSAFVVLTMLLKLQYTKAPTWKSALARVDYVGNAMVIASTCSLLIGLIWGGVQYPWSAWQTIVPIVAGVVGWILFHLYESSPWCTEPTIPSRIFSNRTACAAFMLAFIAFIHLEWITYFLPFYYQAVQGYSPLRSGVNMLIQNLGLLPFAGFAGWLLSKLGKYKYIHWTGFALLSLAFGLFSILDSTSPLAYSVVFQLIGAAGFGSLIICTLPAIQASLPEHDVAAATSVHALLRTFGFVWGVAIPSIVFDNRVDAEAGHISSPSLRAAVVGGGAYSEFTSFNGTWSARDQIITVYKDALRTVWQVGIAFALLGFLLVFVEKQVEMRRHVESEFGIAPAAPVPDRLNTRTATELSGGTEWTEATSPEIKATAVV